MTFRMGFDVLLTKKRKVKFCIFIANFCWHSSERLVHAPCLLTWYMQVSCTQMYSTESKKTLLSSLCERIMIAITVKMTVWHTVCQASRRHDELQQRVRKQAFTHILCRWTDTWYAAKRMCSREPPQRELITKGMKKRFWGYNLFRTIV